MRAFLVLPLVALAAACASPRGQCLAEATRDVRVLDHLIAETELALARGYGVERETTYAPRATFCGGYGYGRYGYYGLSTCYEPYPVTRETPVAIDPAAERRKLAELKAKHREAVVRMKEDVRACNSAYPE